VDQNLRALFERALDDEPVPPPGELARTAMADGARLRRRRRLLGGAAAGLSLAIAAGAALQLSAPPPAVVVAAPGAGCSAAADGRATSVSIFLRTDVTEAQRAALDAMLGSDERVRTYHFESQEQAFEKFKVLWRDDPQTTAAVAADSLPESFRVRLARPEQYASFRAALDRLGGIEDIIGTTCP